MSDEASGLTVAILGGFYFILEGLRLLLWFIFSRKTFMSWLTSKPVDCDEHTMYCPTYNFRGHLDGMTLNSRWVHRKLREGTFGLPDKKHNVKVDKFIKGCKK